MGAGFGAASTPGARREFYEQSLPHSPAEAVPLPGASSLQPIRGGGEVLGGGLGSLRRLRWDEFLGHCGLSFPALEHSQPTPGAARRWSRGAEASAAAAGGGGAGPPGCGHSQRAADTLGQRRAACLEQALRELSDHAAATEQRLGAALRKWDGKAPAAASELARVLDSPKELEGYRARMKAWQASCKDEAWLKWYAAKWEWLSKDLVIVKEQNEALRRERAAVQESLRRTEAACKNVRREMRQHMHKSDILRQEQLFRELLDGHAEAARSDQQLMRQKLPEARAAAEAEKREASESRQRLEEARQALEAERLAEREARRSYLRQRARRVALELQRCSRTCIVAGVSATGLELSLRCGVRASISQEFSAPAGSVRVAFQGPPPPAVDPLAGLGAAMLARAWREAVTLHAEREAKSEPLRRHGSQVVVRGEELPRLLRRLDCSVLRASDRLDALRSLRKDCPEVLHIVAELREGEGPGRGCSGDGALLAIAVTLVVVRSHHVGPGGIVPRRSPADRAGVQGACRVDAAKCVLEFNADLDAFPESINWSDVAVRQVLGRGEAAAVEGTLRGARGSAAPPSGSLAEAVAAAVQAMRRAPAGSAVARR